MSQDPSPRRGGRLARIALALAAVFVAYVAFGFLAAPRIARDLIVEKASAALRREVRISKMRVNPLALSATIEGLAVRHRDGSPFVSWDSLYVRLAPLRIFAGDIGLAEVRLVRPSVHVGIDANGALTFQDLVSGESPSEEPVAEGGDGMGVSIRLLAVEAASVAFSDATRKPAFRTTLGPMTIQLERFRTKGGGDSPYSFTGSTDAGETFRWTGTLAAQPFKSAGTLAFEGIQLPRYGAYVHDEVPVDLRDGLVDVETAYEVEWGPARRVASLSDGKVTLERLAVSPRGAADAPVELPRIEVTGVAVDAIAQTASVAQVAVRGGRVRVARDADGALELARMAPPSSSPTSTPSAWVWAVGTVLVSDLAVDLEDHVPARPVALPLTGVELRVEGLRSASDSTATVDAALVWNGRGRIRVKGPVQPFAAKATLELEAADVDLMPLQPYLEPSFAARLAAGTVGAKVKAGFDASTATPRWTVAGDLRVDGLSVAEKGNDHLLRWRALEITGIDASSTPPRASARVVRLVEPRAKIYSFDDGTTSIGRALPPEPTAAAAAPTRAPADREPQWSTSIGAVQVVRGGVTLVDRTVVPAAIVNVTRADAAVTNLSSDPRVRSKVDARLEVEGASPITVAGTLNPLQKDAYTDLTVTSRGVDLSPLDPYSGRYLGYRIQKGKLDLDLRYKVERRSLSSTNVVTVDQFTLGEETKSPDATKVPVRLALALLQDRNGVILLDVPVEGNLDDPEFRLGKVIWRTILNVLTKVATSPFTALASLVGGGDGADLSMVDFTPGSAEPTSGAEQRFAQLAKSLEQRPALSLELEGAADPAQDGPVLRRVALERSLRRAKAATMRQQPASDGELDLDPDERARLVRAAYDAAFPATPPKQGEAAPRPPAPEEMEARLEAAIEVPPDAYRTLSAERAQRARDALIAAGLDQSRLFLVQGGRGETEKGARVYFTVK